MAAVREWLRDPAAAPRRTAMTAVRFTLEELGALHPGRALEVRVPPAGAVQILQGTTHRRGTPPAVVEMDMDTWLRVALGLDAWADAEEDGRVQASGERAEIGALLPVMDV